ncbi:MAG: MBL fold metallo-hydrolase [Rhodospirillaceae bacterium]|nr:MBL fold metallo-hydrolase [Rhodospirillaceae bacterium]
MKLPGPFHITRVVESEGAFRAPDFILPDATPQAFSETRTSKDPRFVDIAGHRLIMSFHSLIVRTPRNIILVDTCVGNDKQRPTLPEWHMRNGPYLEDLAKAGYPAESITHVLCTHLHADHVGWNTRLINGRWVPTFPNAKYIMHRTEVEHWQEVQKDPEKVANHRSWNDSVQPILDAKQAVIVAGDYEIEPGVRLMPAPGHSPGNIVLVLDDGKDRAFLVGDTLHHPVQIERPHWSSRFCWDAQMSAETRTKFVSGVADTGAWVIPAHFAPPCAVQIIADKDGFWFKTAP